MKAGDSYIGWTSIYRKRDYEAYMHTTRSVDKVHPGIAYMPPAVSRRLLRMDVWHKMNNEVGTAFDIFESEEVPPGRQQAHLAHVLRGAAKRMSGMERRLTERAAELVEESNRLGLPIVVEA